MPLLHANLVFVFHSCTIPFCAVSAHCAAGRRPRDTMRQRSHFRNRRCLARCRRRLGRAIALKPAEEASSITFQIGRRGSRVLRQLRDRPPALQAFRSVLSSTPPVSTHGFSKAPVRTPVATEFNSGERRHHTIKLRFQSIRNFVLWFEGLKFEV